MAHAGPREAATWTGLPAPSSSEPILAPSPGLRSPRSSLLSTQQNRLFQEKVVPPEKMFLHALEALALHVGAPPCPAIILVKVCILPGRERQCTF